MTPDFRDLAGRAVLVTGASTGIGAAVARGFAACGARVGVHYNRSAAEADAVVAGIRAAGGEAWAMQADFATPGAARALVENAAAQLGALDVLINNAGWLLGGRVPFADTDAAFWQAMLNLNLRSLLEATQAALPWLRAAQGAVVNTSSIAARHGGGPGTVVYAAAKGAVSTFTRGLAKEWAPLGVRVNAIAPGIIVTPLHDKLTAPAQMQAFAGQIPMGRVGTPEECVGAYLFLASNALSGYITGQVIEVNGGQLMP